MVLRTNIRPSYNSHVGKSHASSRGSHWPAAATPAPPLIARRSVVTRAFHRPAAAAHTSYHRRCRLHLAADARPHPATAAPPHPAVTVIDTPADHHREPTETKDLASHAGEARSGLEGPRFGEGVGPTSSTPLAPPPPLRRHSGSSGTGTPQPQRRFERKPHHAIFAAGRLSGGPLGQR